MSPFLSSERATSTESFRPSGFLFKPTSTSAVGINSDRFLAEYLNPTIEKLRRYVERERFRGYDPYDALTGWIPFGLGGKWCQAIVTQIHKRNPINLRPLMGIQKRKNAKAIGLFLSVYSKLASQGDRAAAIVARELFEWLLENQSTGFSGSCWGYPFDWVNPKKRVSAGTPSVVVTAFVAKGMWDYFRVFEDERARSTIFSVCSYVLADLHRTRTRDGLCFSYTHLEADCCYNANMLAAEILAIGARLELGGECVVLARSALDFTLAHQKQDGRWNYSLERHIGRERAQIDFHQGFILDSIDAVLRHLDCSYQRSTDALEKGTRFLWREQFFPNGRGKWRLPREWPTEIHNQAQGILTFTRLAERKPEWLSHAQTIAQWTIETMFDERGFFYYQAFPKFINKIPYMRWSQAWMLLALVSLREALKSKSKIQ